MLRLLMISDVYFPRVNGVSTSIQTFRRDLQALGCSSWLVVPAYPAPWSDDPDVIRLPSRYLAFDPEDRLMSTRAVLDTCTALRGRFEIIHIQTPFIAHRAGVKLGRALGIKTVETYHTLFEEYFHHYLPLLPEAWLRGLARAVSRRQCGSVDAVVAPSTQMERVLRDYGVRTPLEVIPTGLDMSEFAGGDGARFRARFGIAAARPVMLHVGRVAFEKNIGFVLRVAAGVRRSVPDMLLVIAGEGPALVKLRREAQALGLADHVLFVGYLDRRSELLDCYRAANVFVFASNTETQGLVLLEALALGVPVVSTAVLGTKDVLNGARGAIVVDEDLDAFVAAATDVLRRPELQGRLATEAKGFIEAHWSSREMARRMIGLYEKVLDST